MFNPMVNKVSLKFLFPIVSARDVADQVLDAILWGRDEIIIPYHLKFLGFLKDYVLPSSFTEWMLFQVSGRRPLDAFQKEPDEISVEKRRKHPQTTY